MTLQVVNWTNAGVGIRISLGTTDDLLVGRDGLIASTDGAATVYGVGSDHTLRVEGTIAGAMGIDLGGNPSVDSNERVVIAATGVVAGDYEGIYFSASASHILNYGLIDSEVYAIHLRGEGNGATEIRNAGVIHGGFIGIFAAVFEALAIRNTGEISGGTFSVLGAGGNDFLRNSGQVFGDVSFGSGNDTYDGRGGSIEGAIFGDDGDDMFRPGLGIETINGGTGWDTLDFRSGGAIRVALDGSLANTGRAEDDVYTGIDGIYGSTFGGDVLTGDAAANGFRGFGGADSLSGGGGNDRLFGGRGSDVLSGGAGNDRFVFENLGESGDVVSDFGNVAGNDDIFHIAATAFGAGLVAGALAAFQFQSRADNLAQDADDRFIFRTTDTTLWFDANGNVAGGLTQLADLQAGVVLTAGDILLI